VLFFLSFIVSCFSSLSYPHTIYVTFCSLSSSSLSFSTLCSLSHLLDFNTQQHTIPIFSLFPHPCRSSAAPMTARLQTTSGGSRLLSPGACSTWKLPNWVFQFQLNVSSLGSILFWVSLSKCSRGIRDFRDFHVFV